MKGGDKLLPPAGSNIRWSSNPSALYWLCKILPIATYLLPGGSLRDTATFIVTVVAFLVEKNICGLQLVGLKWSFDFHSMSFVFYSKPEPFIPSKSLSNSFWGGTMGACFFWVVAFFISILMRMTSRGQLAFVCLAFEVVNFVLFARAHSDGRQLFEQTALKSINEGAEFELVPDDGI